MSKSKQPPDDAPRYVPVCAIGASAGGVGALQTLFRLLPDDLGLAYVVVVHLAPDQPSAMHEILGACTRMPVLQVKDGPTLKADCVYVIAPDSELVIEGDNVQARPFSDPRGRRAPIDMFFRSIAAGRGDGIAVVLTGAGSDGALGVRAIKEAGGIVMVQEPAEAGFPSMPQNAIATGVADVVAPLARLAERIAEAAHSKKAVRSLDEDGAANDIRRIVAFLRTRTGHDFSGYKRSTVLRRIQRRMQVRQIVDLADYLQHLRAQPEEAKELLSDLLISVTMFFRDPASFVALTHRVIHPLLESRSAGDTEDEFRAWVVGCATGEEAYSLAILLLEEAEQLKVNVPIQIFATDLDEGALATAREGRYPRSIEADVSAERLKRFFVDEGTHYRIDRRVRDLILFATHSVVREPPFMRLDLITCRNVLIYLERSLQSHVNSIFRYGLKLDGYLFLGTAETADTSANQFAVVDRDARIYRALPARPDFVPTLAVPTGWSAARPALTESRLAVSRLDAGEVLGEGHAAALEASAPPSALVDAGQAVLHLSPTAGRFILLSAGPLSGRLPSIVRPELRLDLKLALDRALAGRQPSITRPIEVAMEGATRRVALHVAPLPAGEGAAPRAIVYFLDGGPGQAEDADEHAPPSDELQHLHSELKVAQEAELAGRIRHDSAVQELRASNEELQSLNEEYRSTAEELETSKEELQSINEELQTVNAELKSKLGIISAAHNDLQNLTASSEIGTLFLDLDLRIRMFTPRVAELINVAEADVGRPITNFTHRLDYDDIAADIRRVLRDLTPIETEVRTLDGRWFLVRVRPYRTMEGEVEGAVATFDDITKRKQAEEGLAEELRNTLILQDLSARLVTEDNIQTIYEDILTAAIEITRAQAGTVQMLDAEARELVTLATRGFSRRTREHFHRVDAGSNTSCGLALRTGERSYCNFDPSSADASDRLHVEDGMLSAQSSPLVSRSGKPIGMVTTHWDEPDHRPSERGLRSLDLLVRQAADLIEQRRSEAALRESAEKYRSVFEGIDEGFLVAELVYDAAGTAIDYRFVEVNPAFERQTGLANVTGKLDSEVVTGTERRWIEIYAEVARTGESKRFEDYHEPTRHWYDVHVSRLRGTAGSRVSIVFTDITERRLTETALRRSEETLAGQREALELALKGGPLEQSLDVLGQTAVKLFEHDVRFAFYLADAEGAALRHVVGMPEDYAAEVEDFGIGADSRAGGPAAYADRPVLTADVTDEPGWEPWRDLAARHDYRGCWSFPIHLPDGAYVGSFDLYWRAPREAREDDVRMAGLIARSAAVIIARDIDAGHLRESEERYRELFERIDEGFCIIEMIFDDEKQPVDYRFIAVNPAFERHTGIADAEGRLMRDIAPDHEQHWFDHYGAIALTGQPQRFAAPATALGDRYFDLNAFRVGEPEQRRVAIVFSDITKRRRAEAALRESEQRQQSLVEGLPQLVWRAVDGGQWTWASPQWTTYTGQAEPDSHGWGWLDPVHPDDRDRVRQVWAVAIERGGFHADYRIRHAEENRYRWFQTRATPVRDDGGEIIEWLGTSTDVDDLRQLQERQQVLVAELQHRTFNLLGMVRSTADATIRSSDSLADFKSKFGDRIGALARVQRLLSRITDDDRVTFDALIRGELEAVGALQNGGGRVVLEGPQGVALRSSTVQTFAMALHELTTNAVKYGALRQAGASLAVRWWVEDGEDGEPWLHMDWRETGVSPPAEDQPRGTGQGRTLIEEALPYQLRAKTSYVMTADGVHCAIALPVSARTVAERGDDTLSLPISRDRTGT